MTDASDSDSNRFDVLRADPKLAAYIDEHGVPTVAPHDDPFHRVVTTIVNQQLSTQSAAAIRERVFERFDITPEGLLAADEDALRDAGLSRQKVRYLRNVATAWDDTFDPARYTEMPNDAVVDAVTVVTGIGEWTAKMYLMFVLGREDVFPVEDLGIRNAMTQLYGYEDRPAMNDHAETWAPYRTHASLALWRTVD